MKKIFVLILMMLISLPVYAVNSYDRYGNKTGSYNTSGNTTTQYDRYGNKTGSYKTDNYGITTTQYDVVEE